MFMYGTISKLYCASTGKTSSWRFKFKYMSEVSRSRSLWEVSRYGVKTYTCIYKVSRSRRLHEVSRPRNFCEDLRSFHDVWWSWTIRVQDRGIFLLSFKVSTYFSILSLKKIWNFRFWKKCQGQSPKRETKQLQQKQKKTEL